MVYPSFPPSNRSANEFIVLQDEIAALSEEHRQYLLARHGTLEMDPIPDMTDADPYNWSQKKVRHFLFQELTIVNPHPMRD